MRHQQDHLTQPKDKDGFPTVLVAANNGTFRLLVDSLQQDGCLVLEAHSEQEALRVASIHSRKIDVLLADASVNGPFLNEALKPYRLETRVLLTKGQPQDALAEVRQLLKCRQEK